MTNRRDFITLIGGAAAWPLAARAQQGERVRRVGVLMNAAATETVSQSYLAAFVEGLRQLGWTEGKNLRIDVRWNAGDAQLARIYAAQRREILQANWAKREKCNHQAVAHSAGAGEIVACELLSFGNQGQAGL